MLEFQEIKIEDKEWMDPILRKSGHIGYEGAFGTRFIWSGSYGSKYCYQNGSLFFITGKKEPIYSYPLGDGDPKEAILLMEQDARERGKEFKMWGMTEDQKKIMEELFPDKFDYELDRDSADYIYSAEDLIHLAGRKFHGKRNHLSQFSRAYNFTYEDVTPQNLADCEAIAREWCKENGNCGEEAGLDKESCALHKTFHNFEKLQFSGGLIRIDGKPVAFTIGEEINEDAYLLHFEKALSGYNGLYTAINHEYASHRLGGYRYINREDDMGIEGLRKAKLSYYPVIILERYGATSRR